MQRHQSKEGLEWLTFDLFKEFPRLVHGVFLRHGGASNSPYDSLNFSTTSGDDLLHVSLNRKKALNSLKLNSWASLWEIHGKDIVEANPSLLQSADGHMTNCLNLALIILHADCQAAIFYDPYHHAVANVHCGWRGNVQNIYKEAIQAMHQRFGSRPEDLLVGISPSLGPQTAEFINFRKELPEEFWQFQIKPTYFDLWQISRWQLEEAGVLPHHIEIAEICTFENSRDFFSYRREKKSGRHATIAALK